MRKPLFILLALFGFVELCRYFLGGAPFRQGMTAALVHGTNFLMLVISLVALWMLNKSLGNKNPHAFVRAVMGSMIIKMFILLGGLVVFLTSSAEMPDRQAIIASLAIYFAYLVTEVALAMKMNRTSHAKA